MKKMNTIKPIGRIPAAQWAAMKPMLDMIEADEQKRDANDNSIHCYIQSNAQIDFLKMILPDNVSFKVVG